MGPLLGVILSAIGIKMPELVLAAIKPLGLSATAAALFLTGVILSARKLQINTMVITSTIAKLLIQPAIAGYRFNLRSARLRGDHRHPDDCAVRGLLWRGVR